MRKAIMVYRGSISQLRNALRAMGDKGGMAGAIADAAAVEISDIRAFAAHVEHITATGGGLSPDDTVALHLMARDVLMEQKP